MGTTITRAAAAAGTAEVWETTLHRGGCHCGDVRFEVEAASRLVVWDCNCSNCRMRRNVHFVVPADKLHIVSEAGTSLLAEYRFGSGAARHLFCARCGVSPFYRPRSNPDGWAVTFQCLDPGTVSGVEVRRFDGHNWEGFIKTSGIAEFSKSTSASEVSPGSGANKKHDSVSSWAFMRARHGETGYLRSLARLAVPRQLLGGLQPTSRSWTRGHVPALGSAPEQAFTVANHLQQRLQQLYQAALYYLALLVI